MKGLTEPDPEDAATGYEEACERWLSGDLPGYGPGADRLYKALEDVEPDPMVQGTMMVALRWYPIAGADPGITRAAARVCAQVAALLAREHPRSNWQGVTK